MKIFFDVDTQNDFMNKDGALYVPDSELIKPNLSKLTIYALKNKIPVIGSVDRHFDTEEYKQRETELARWGGPFPNHCMDGTLGKLKINETIGYGINDSGEDINWYIQHHLAEDEKNYEWITPFGKDYTLSVGIYFEKQCYDMFTNPALEKFLKQTEVSTAVVYGVATDYCIKAAVLGMQKIGIQCYVVDDAIKGVFPEGTKKALEEMMNAGARFTTTKEVLEDEII